jgi:hypothetical protein
MLQTGKFPVSWKNYMPIFIRKANTRGQMGEDYQIITIANMAKKLKEKYFSKGYYY